MDTDSAAAASQGPPTTLANAVVYLDSDFIDASSLRRCKRYIVPVSVFFEAACCVLSLSLQPASVRIVALLGGDTTDQLGSQVTHLLTDTGSANQEVWLVEECDRMK